MVKRVDLKKKEMGNRRILVSYHVVLEKDDRLVRVLGVHQNNQVTVKVVHDTEQAASVKGRSQFLWDFLGGGEGPQINS